MSRSVEIVCPAGTPAALRAAVAAGADVVYVGFRDETNARNFPGLNFSRRELAEALEHAHTRGVRVYLAVNTYPRAGDPHPWRQAVDDGARLGVDAVIVADFGLALYARERWPDLRLHLSVQASAANPEAIAYFAEEAGIRRVVLPRVLTLERLESLVRACPVECEVFVFGGLCVMAEGRCFLSGHVAGRSPNTDGVCSPAEAVTYETTPEGTAARLAGLLVDVHPPGEAAGYPTLCKGRFRVGGRIVHPFADPVSLDARAMLPRLVRAGVAAVKIEGRQRGRAYVARVVRAVREAVAAALRGEPIPELDLDGLVEGGRRTAGALERSWR